MYGGHITGVVGEVATCYWPPRTVDSHEKCQAVESVTQELSTVIILLQFKVFTVHE